MESVGDRKDFGAHALSTKTIQDNLYRLPLTRNNDVLRPIHRGDGYRIEVGANGGRHESFLLEDGGHHTILDQSLHESGPCSNQLKGNFQRENTGYTGRHVLPYTVA